MSEAKRGRPPIQRDNDHLIYISYSIWISNRAYIAKIQADHRLDSESEALRLILDAAEQQEILLTPGTDARPA